MAQIVHRNERFSAAADGAIEPDGLHLPAARPYRGSVRTFDEFKEALSAVHDQYVQWDYRAPHSHGIHVTRYLISDYTSTYVSIEHGMVRHTASLVIDSPQLGLPLDTAFQTHRAVEWARARGTIAEGTALAARHLDEAGVPIIRHGPMTTLREYEQEAVSNHATARMNIFGQNVWFIQKCEQHGIDALFLVVNPRHLAAWTRTSPHVHVLSESRAIPHVRDAPGVLIGLDMAELRGELLHSSGPPRSPFIRHVQTHPVTVTIEAEYRPTEEQRKELSRHLPVE